MIMDGVRSLLRQRLFRLHSAGRITQESGDVSQMFGSFLVAHQPGPLKISRFIFGGAISFALLVLSCALTGGGQAHSTHHPAIHSIETETAQALAPSDLMSVSDECAGTVRVGCPPESADSAGMSDNASRTVQSRPDELPFPSGRFGIGQASYRLSPSEMPASGITSAEPRLFIWYPAAIDPDTSAPIDNVWGFSKSMGKFIQTHTIANAAITGGSSRFPLILFSPAAGNESAAYLSQIENLVSHGYIVASLQNSEGPSAIWFQDTGLTVFETDMRRAFFFSASRNPDAVLARAEGFERSRETAESAKLRFAFNQVILIATDRSRRAPFAGRIDLEYVGVFGHASGGNAVARLCASDPRISACVDENGWTSKGLLTEGNPSRLPRQPFLWIDMPMKWLDGAELTYAQISRDRFGRLAKASAVAADRELKSLMGGAYRISLLTPDLNDKNFTDGPLVWSMKRGHIGDAKARAALAVINVYSRTFFDKYLKGRSAPLLNSNATSPFSKVRFQSYGVQ